jgi:hypothetical protein
MRINNKHVAVLDRAALVAMLGAVVALGTCASPVSRTRQAEAQIAAPKPHIDYIHLNGRAASSIAIASGDSVTIEIQVTNVGTAAGYRTGIGVSFPDFDSYIDIDFVDLVNLWSSNGDDDLRYIEYRPGYSQMWSECGSGHVDVAQELLVAGYAPSKWEPGEKIVLEIKLTPPKPGNYEILVKAAVADAIDGDSYYYDPARGPYIDQQCQYAYRRTIEVVEVSERVYMPVVSANYQPQSRPLRAVWVQASSCSSPSACDRLLGCLQASGATRIYYLLYYGRAYYHSDLMPHLNFDSLAYLVPAAHARNIEVFGTIPVAYMGWPQHPEWNARYNHRMVTRSWLDFAVPEARAFVAAVAEEIVTNYDVDGISLDYIRWHQDWYRQAGLSAEDISLTVKGVYERMKTVRPDALLTATPHADHEYADRMRGQRWQDWLDGGYIDYVDPMCYRQGAWLRSRLREFQDTGHFPGRIIPLLAASNFYPERQKPADQLIEEIQLCRDAGAVGIALWCDRWLCGNQVMIEALGAGGW